MTSIADTWMPAGTFHHFGFVVASIEQAAPSFAESMTIDWDGCIIYDPIQGVRVSFLRGHHSADPLLELVEPAGESSPVFSFLKRGGGLHHVCYVVDSLDRQMQESRAKRSLIVREPAPAVAFGGRRIAWTYTRSKLLIEYLER